MSTFSTFLNNNREVDYILEKETSHFLAQTGFSALRFARIYKDGTCFTACTEKGIQEYLFKYHVRLVLDETNPTEDLEYYFVPKSGRHVQDYYHYKNFNIYSIVNLILRTSNYIEFIALYSQTSQEKTANKIANRSETIKAGVKEFLPKIEAVATNNSLILPACMIPIYGDNPGCNIEPLTGKVDDTWILKDLLETAMKRVDNAILTFREEQCVKLCILNFSAKETAEVLKVSSRTVENHLNSAKIKLQLGLKSDFKTYFLKFNAKDIL